MRCAIIADIHANLAAFTAVLDDIKDKGGVDELWCLGDIVGYGPDPHQCIELLREHKHVCVAGNHDWAAIGKIDTPDLNSDAAAVWQWTSEQLTPKDTVYLHGLPLVVEKEDFTLAHGSPRGPMWEYLLSISSARQNFIQFKSPFCLVGHSHMPLVFRDDGNGKCSFAPLSPDIGLALGKKRMIINPGSVGQPRDGDPRASYAICDTEARMVRIHRVSYDINLTQNSMVKHNLPMRLVARLSQGV